MPKAIVRKLKPSGSVQRRANIPFKKPARNRAEFSEHEAAVVTRLVKLLREPDYWLGAFIEWLLEEDLRTDCSDGLTVKEVVEKLTDMDAARGWLSSFSRSKDGPILRYLAHDKFPAQVDRAYRKLRSVINAPEDEGFLELVRMWRLKYPAPEKRIQRPTGHLGREESGD